MQFASNRGFSLLTLAAFAALLFAGCGGGSGPRSVSGDKTPKIDLPLAWSDEFDGPGLDMTKWNIETGYGGNGWGNDEWQEYTADFTPGTGNLAVEGGELIITARSNGGFGKRDGSITSARITTENKMNVRFGKIQARIRVPGSEATWPAFWALGGNFRSVGWPKCGEIDVMEVLNRFSDGFTTHATVHWWNEAKFPPNVNPPEQWDFRGGSRSFADPLSDDYHVYEVERTEMNLIFRIDGLVVYVQPLDATMSELADEFFLLLNIAIGGTHGADPNAGNFPGPQEMRIDWVRVYAEPGEWRDPPDPSLTRRGIVSETHINPVLGYSSIINTINWSADWAASDTESTAVTPKEGLYSMSVDYDDRGAWGGGPVFQVDGADFTQFAGLTTYNALVFSMNTSAMPTFADIGVVLEDPQGQAGQAAVRLKDYTPEVDGDWKTYVIPIDDFAAANAAADLTNVNFFMFLTPVNAADEKVSGTFYLDDIHLAAFSTTEAGILSEQYVNPAVPLNRVFSSQEWGSPPTTVNPMSTEVAPFEGDYVLTVDVTGNAWGGAIFDFPDADFTTFSSLATYNTLAFSLNSTATPALADLTVEIQDGSGAGPKVMLSSLTPIDNGAWQTYEIPLTSFGGVDLESVNNVLFVNPLDGGGNPIPGKFHLDDIHLTTRLYGPPPPAGILSESRTDPVLAPDRIHSSSEWGSAPTAIDAASGILAFEGPTSLRVDFGGTTAPHWGGAVFAYSGADFTVGGDYNALVFSLNTTQFPNFGDLTIEIQDGGAKPGALLSNYLPRRTGDWYTYTIPLADFFATDTTNVTALLFFNAVDTGGNPADGVYFVDDVHLVYAPPPKGIYSEQHSNPVLANTPSSNVIMGWGGSDGTLTVPNPAVTAFEGADALSWDHGATGPGWGGVMFEFPVNVDVTDGGDYTMLVFSIDVSTFAGFADVEVQFQDGSLTGTVWLSNYTPVENGNWHTYHIPFADLSAANLQSVKRLLFFNPSSTPGVFTPAAGEFHLDDVHLR